MSSIMPTILLIDDDSNLRRYLKEMLEKKGFDVSSFATFKEAILFFGANKYDVVIINMRMGRGDEGLEVLSWASKISPSTRVIITSAYESYKDAFLAGELGMYAYIPKCEEACYEEIMKKIEDALVFDTFVSYKRDDQIDVRQLCHTLAANGLRIWVDYERVHPGTNWLDAIQTAMSSCRSGILVFGKEGIGKWQKTEIESLLQLVHEADIRIIPVLLPGVNEPPADLPILRSYHYLQLNPCLRSGCVCDQLVNAITGQHKRYRRFEQQT